MSLEDVMRTARKQALFSTSAMTMNQGFNRTEIQRMLPHRDPTLLIDRVDAFDSEDATLMARRTIDSQDPIFEGHFPGEPIYPGVLLIEAMSQAAVCLRALLDSKGKLPSAAPNVRLLRVYDTLFQAEVLPGDEIMLLVRQIERRSYTAVYAAQVMVGQKICALTMTELYLVE